MTLHNWPMARMAEITNFNCRRHPPPPPPPSPPSSQLVVVVVLVHISTL